VSGAGFQVSGRESGDRLQGTGRRLKILDLGSKIFKTFKTIHRYSRFQNRKSKIGNRSAPLP
jgi:hypothetical protein